MRTDRVFCWLLHYCHESSAGVSSAETFTVDTTIDRMERSGS